MARVRDEVRKLEKEEVELGDKMTSLQTGVHRGNERLDQFKLLMNWNQEELEQWALASRQKEEDNLVGPGKNHPPAPCPLACQGRARPTG